MSDPFGDLDETLEETSDEPDDRTSDETGGGTENGADGEAESKADSETLDATDDATLDGTEGETDQTTSGSGDTTSSESATADNGGSETTDKSLSSPAFPFAEAEQTAVYPRTETWAAFEDFLDFEVRRRLREADVRDDTKRELHEAALQVVQNHPEAVAEQFLANRRETGDDTE